MVPRWSIRKFVKTARRYRSAEESQRQYGEAWLRAGRVRGSSISGIR
jgi:hypothetical protein